MTAQELLDEIDDCYGPCCKICISCPEGHYLKEIREVVAELLRENKELKFELDGLKK